VDLDLADARPQGSDRDAIDQLSSTERSAGALHWRASWKRPLDLVVGGSTTILLLPLLAVLAVLVKMDSKGPILFRQERVGLNGARFQMLKFRSMRHNSDERAHRASAMAWFAGQTAAGPYKSLADPRVTRVGRFLRRTSLDELPQLFNVLRGDMSLVGPRPAIEYELEHYLPWYYERQMVKPGMTGLWQVSGRTQLSAGEMMALDVRYVHEVGLGLDLKILALTVPALLGLSSAGA